MNLSFLCKLQGNIHNINQENPNFQMVQIQMRLNYIDQLKPTIVILQTTTVQQKIISLFRHLQIIAKKTSNSYAHF